MEPCKIHNIDNCTICIKPDMSEADATLDTMVQQASVPSLATLFRKAKESGAIQPVAGYGGPTASAS